MLQPAAAGSQLIQSADATLDEAPELVAAAAASWLPAAAGDAPFDDAAGLLPLLPATSPVEEPLATDSAAAAAAADAAAEEPPDDEAAAAAMRLPLRQRLRSWLLLAAAGEAPLDEGAG